MRIAGCGCALADLIYTNVAFNGEAMRPLRSRELGDGGVVPGGLVFAEDFQKFVGMSSEDAIAALVGGRRPDHFNVGGPAIVALILAAQLLAGDQIAVDYFGTTGQDELAERIRTLVAQTPLGTADYTSRPGPTPRTLVLSDPQYDGGHGERAFVNQIGTAGEYGPNDLSERFFDADLVLFGATALMPRLHGSLSRLIVRAKEKGSLVVVTTVYDFPSEQRAPDKPWPLGEDERSWQHMDLLITDREEALRLSGAATLSEAVDLFRDRRLAACIITAGPDPVTFYAAEESLFERCQPSTLPVSSAVGRNKDACAAGDTTGCGDNFAGGVLAWLACQRAGEKKELRPLSLPVAAGICAGGAARFHLGGIKLESQPGERRREIGQLYADYRSQVASTVTLPKKFLG